MNGLILYISEEQVFDQERVFQLFLSIEQIYDHNFGSVTPDSPRHIEGEYDYGEYSTTVTLNRDSGAIGLSGVNDAAIDLAFRIQQGYPEPVRVIDWDYSFDFAISDFSSAADLRAAIYEAIDEDT